MTATAATLQKDPAAAEIRATAIAAKQAGQVLAGQISPHAICLFA